MNDVASARQELLQRPTLEEESRRLTAVRDEIGDALVREFKLGGWKELPGGNRAGCQDSAVVEGEIAFLPFISLDEPLPDARWPDAVRLISDIAAGHGFGEPQSVFDQPGERLVVWHGERESVLNVKNIGDVAIKMDVGCHLPAVEHAK